MIDYEAAWQQFLDNDVEGPEEIALIVKAALGDDVLYEKCSKGILSPPHTHGCELIRGVQVYPVVSDEAS